MPHSRAKREVMITMTKAKPGSCAEKSKSQGTKTAEKTMKKVDNSKRHLSSKKVDLSSILKSFRH